MKQLTTILLVLNYILFSSCEKMEDLKNVDALDETHLITYSISGNNRGGGLDMETVTGSISLVENSPSWITRRGTCSSEIAHYVIGSIKDTIPNSKLYAGETFKDDYVGGVQHVIGNNFVITPWPIIKRDTSFLDSITISEYNGGGILSRLLDASTSDSLFTSTDKPTSTWEDNPLTLGMQFTVSKAGTAKALKFYKTDARTNNYIITLWNGSAIVTTTSVSTSKTGWIRIPVDISLQAGTYVLSFYNPVGRYGYTNNQYPRNRGVITGNAGKYEYGSVYPGRNGTCYFLDLVFESDNLVPLSIKTSPDRDVIMPKDSVGVSATAAGYTSFKWTIEDSQGKFELKNTNTLNPYVIPLDSSGCRVWLMCTVTDAAGNELADMVAVRVAPHPKMVIAYLLYDGTIIYRIKPTFIELP